MLPILRYILSCSSVFLLSLIITTNAVATTNNNQQQPSTSVTANNTPKQQVAASININTADATTLQTIKGMSKKKVAAILQYRQTHGFFKSLEDLLKVNCRGIHKNWLQKISTFLTV